MLAAVLRGFNQLDLEDLPRPEPGPGEVLVRIKSCGFCATDYKAIKGIRRNVTFPLIPGHEPAGIIAAVGPFVTNVKEGDEVLFSAQRLLWTVPELPAGADTLLRTGLHHRGRRRRVPAGKLRRVYGDRREHCLPQTGRAQLRCGLPGRTCQRRLERIDSLFANAPG